LNAAPSEIERRIASFKEAVKASGVKLTHQRLEVFREVAASLDHPDADTIFRAVRRRVPTVSLDTVYRTLWQHNDLGLITTRGPRRESVRFDANLTHHHHYVCVQCGLARDFESAALSALRPPEAVKRLGSISGTHVEVRGICELCMKRARTPSRPGSPGNKRGKGARDSTSPELSSVSGK
jgi:Fur family peroxide stress response transcriptional regulator